MLLHSPAAQNWGCTGGRDGFSTSAPPPARPGLISSMESCKYFANKAAAAGAAPKGSGGDKDAERRIRARDTPEFPWRRRQRSLLP